MIEHFRSLELIGSIDLAFGGVTVLLAGYLMYLAFRGRIPLRTANNLWKLGLFFSIAWTFMEILHMMTIRLLNQENGFHQDVTGCKRMIAWGIISAILWVVAALIVSRAAAHNSIKEHRTY